MLHVFALLDGPHGCCFLRILILSLCSGLSHLLPLLLGAMIPGSVWLAAIIYVCAFRGCFRWFWTFGSIVCEMCFPLLEAVNDFHGFHAVMV